MPLDSFANLKAAFVDELLADELTVAQQDDIVAKAEDRLGNDFEFSRGEVRATATLAQGDRRLALPTDYIETRSMRLTTDPVTQLEFVTPQDLFARRGGSTTGKPVMYAVEADEFLFGPAADIAYTVEQIYQAEFLPLSDLQTSNFVLTNHSVLYLRACLVEAAIFMQDDGLMTKYELLYQQKSGEEDLEDWKRRAAGRVMQVRHDYGGF